MNWNSEERLRIIKALVILGPQDETSALFKERIMFLCDMPSKFLEGNKDQYTEAIKLAEAGITYYDSSHVNVDGRLRCTFCDEG